MAEEADPKKELSGAGGEGKAYDSIERDFQEVRRAAGGWRQAGGAAWSRAS
jgi:hypothetical protein